MGENPIEKTITLTDKWNYYYLELSPDGTALYVDDDDNETEYKFKYTYDADTKKIYMRLEKAIYDGSDLIYIENPSLMTYNEIISRINKDHTVENVKETLKEYYAEEDKVEFPNYDSFENFVIEQEGFDNLVDCAEYWKQALNAYYKAIFGAQVTYAYKIDSDGKMTLTEKFTGVKNMLDSECEYYDSSSGTRCYIRSDWAYIYEYNDGEGEYYYGVPDTDKKTIAFENKDDGTQVNATYTENLSKETVTIKFNDKEYVCKFEGEKFIEE